MGTFIRKNLGMVALGIVAIGLTAIGLTGAFGPVVTESLFEGLVLIAKGVAVALCTVGIILAAVGLIALGNKISGR